MELREYLKKHRLLADGAMGTYYAHLQDDDNMVSELGNLDNPKIIERIHKEYIQAGARLIRTNTFAASREVLGIDAFEQKKLMIEACQIAKRAAGERFRTQKGDDEVFIAGDIGPIPRHGESTQEEIIQEYKIMCDIFIEQNVSAIMFETFPEIEILEEVIAYVRNKSKIFIIFDFSISKNGYTSMGISANRILEKCKNIEGLDAVGLNCGIGSGHMNQQLRKLELPKNKWIVVMPNAGYPEQLSNRMVFMDNTDYFVDNMKEISSLGVNILGGCCGTTPKYIEKLAKKISFEPYVVAVSVEENKEQPREEEKVKLSSFYQKLLSGEKVVAVELDPPYDADYEKLIEQAQYLKEHNTDIITISDSPGGRSRADSILMSLKLNKEVGIDVMPHMSCRDRNMIAMRSTILGAYINDIRNVLLVTGDPVPGANRGNVTSVFDYNSIRLMEFAKEMNQEHFSKEPIIYGGALNYAGRLDKIVERMKRKVDQGASYFLTQPIYSDEDIEQIYQIKKQIDTKILCGIMPFTSYRNANFMKNEMAGIHVPEEIVNRYSMEMSKEEAEQTGADIASEIIEKLHTFADGYYFMLPFNRVTFMNKIIIK